MHKTSHPFRPDRTDGFTTTKGLAINGNLRATAHPADVAVVRAGIGDLAPSGRRTQCGSHYEKRAATLAES